MIRVSFNLSLPILDVPVAVRSLNLFVLNVFTFAPLIRSTKMLGQFLFEVVHLGSESRSLQSLY